MYYIVDDVINTYVTNNLNPGSIPVPARMTSSGLSIIIMHLITYSSLSAVRRLYQLKNVYQLHHDIPIFYFHTKTKVMYYTPWVRK